MSRPYFLQGARMEWIDLRSDTITNPTPEMWAAMANAEVGDDVYGEDPSVNKLEALAAERMGQEAGLFVPSGTMGNLAAVLACCGRGDEIILGDHSHTFLYEAGGISALGGVHPHTIPNQPDGTLDLGDIKTAIRPNNIHFPITRLVILENTHNRCGGVPLSVEYVCEVAELANKYNLWLHIDGPRIFNAAVALGIEASTLAEPADSVTFCLSKALCAPVGSVLCGSRDFIAQARRIRKQLGGGMRQAGVLAAAGIIALETMIDRLAEDHARARRLAAGLNELPNIFLDSAEPPTNMIFFDLNPKAELDAAGLVASIAKEGIKLAPSGARRIRLVLHYWIDDAAVNRTLAAFRKELGKA